MNLSGELVPSGLDEVEGALISYKKSLSAPFDSYLEERLYESEITKILLGDELAGFAAVTQEQLYFFHIIPKLYRAAGAIFELFVKETGIGRVHSLTSDPLLQSLLVEWETRPVEYIACYFTDAGRREKPKCKAAESSFRPAVEWERQTILNQTGDFFDRLEERISQKTIFVLEDDGEALGYGIVERGRFFGDCMSIGMITLPRFRDLGVAKTILWNLKEYVYSHGLRPVAGCWYYNTLSRKSLEASGLIASAKGLTLELVSKQVLPKRTGNPPGELVE